MNFHLLTSQFYDDYAECDQILLKDKRPYCFSICEVDGLLIAVPLRSNLNPYNKYVIKTPGTTGGLDLTKSVVITDRAKYIESRTSPLIRREDFRFLLGKDYFLECKVKKFIQIYKKRAETQIDDNSLLKFCSLKYFHKELNITAPEDTSALCK